MQRRIAIAVAAVAAAVAAVALLLAAGGGGKGLGPESSAGQVRAVAGNVTVIPSAERRTLPEFHGTTVAGAPLDLASLRGHVLVLNFWASWCGPCRSEQRGLLAASRDLAGDGVRFVGVDLRDSRAGARTYLEEYGVGYPSLFDPAGELAQRLRDQGPDYPPFTLVVDAHGQIAARIHGALGGGEGTPQGQAALLRQVVQDATGSGTGSGAG